MNIFCILLLAASLGVATATPASDKDKAPVSAPVDVAVYYESLCPDSIKFFTKQLYPAFKKFGSAINLQLVPFGKSTHIRSENGSYVFDCHHGPNECFGNKVQACALRHLDDKGDQVKYINCLMDKVKPKETPFAYPGEKCAKDLSLKYDLIQTCVNSTDGDDQLDKQGTVTDALNPKLTSVPTVVFKGKYSKDEASRAEKDFESVLCSFLGGNKGNKECKNSAASNSAAVLLSVVAVLVARMF